MLVVNPLLCKEWNYDKNEKDPENYYPNSKSKVWWKCSKCQFEWEASISNRNTLHRGCPQCAIKNNSGSNHYFWNPNLTNEERENNRATIENKIWRNEVFERDNYACRICGAKGKLNAHHLDGYHWCIERRFDVDNGIALCENKCHKEFHHLYGNKNNTEQQFWEFLLFKNNQINIK